VFGGGFPPFDTQFRDLQLLPFVVFTLPVFCGFSGTSKVGPSGTHLDICADYLPSFAESHKMVVHERRAGRRRRPSHEWAGTPFISQHGPCIRAIVLGYVSLFRRSLSKNPFEPVATLMSVCVPAEPPIDRSCSLLKVKNSTLNLRLGARR